MSRLGVPRTGEPISWTHSGARRAFDEFLFRTYLTNPLNYFGPSFVVQGVTRDNLALPSRGEQAGSGTLRPPGTGKDERRGIGKGNNGECDMVAWQSNAKRCGKMRGNDQCPMLLHTTATLCNAWVPPSPRVRCRLQACFTLRWRHSRGGYNTPPMLVCTAVATLESRTSQELAIARPLMPIQCLSPSVFSAPAEPGRSVAPRRRCAASSYKLSIVTTIAIAPSLHADLDR
jgi:hypothetical protein